MTSKNNKPRIGFVGLGLMGVPMCVRLLAAGFSLNVWNRSSGKAQSLQAQGAQLSESLAELVRESDIIMLCVSDSAAVADVVFQSGGIADVGTADKLLVDFSSIAPEAARHYAQKLKSQNGMSWVDAPVSGGVAGAETGTLVVMAGGDEQCIDDLRPVLSALSQRVTRMGEVGCGQATKVCNQMIVSCNVLVMAEVLALAEKTGVDANKIPVALQGGFADSIPLQLTGTRMAAHDFDELKWHVKTLLKDLSMAGDMASSEDAQTPMSTLARELMQEHSDNGFAEQDPATLIKLYSETSKAKPKL